MSSGGGGGDGSNILPRGRVRQGRDLKLTYSKSPRDAFLKRPRPCKKNKQREKDGVLCVSSLCCDALRRVLEGEDKREGEVRKRRGGKKDGLQGCVRSEKASKLWDGWNEADWSGGNGC